MANRLANETSPYLLQHAQNPVDWYPWGDEALARSRQENKPIFLSIGYAACHWCHVMEHESFEDAGIARLMSEHFVCIKVDREERPDLDQIYMNAVQLMTGRGGWPMSVFLTPELKPFYGGTYWPPHARMGMPGFDQVLTAVHEAWTHRQEQAREQATELAEHIRSLGTSAGGSGNLTPQLLDRAQAALERSFDPRWGGFGQAPKFPHPMDLRLLLRIWRRNPNATVLAMVTLTLDKMAAAGMYDQLGGGFHRYSVDERWLVPHFEKMLYDNALLAQTYLEGYLATGNGDYARTVRETCDYVLREMTDPQGGFYSTQDADSEGEEGKFFVWTPAQIEDVLGPEAAKTFCYVYDVTPEGNFEGKNILNLPKTLAQCAQLLNQDLAELEEELRRARQKLFEARERRVHPGRDDKVIVSWNGLMIDAMSAAGASLSEPRYVQAAEAAANFLVENLRRPDGRLLHTWRHGQAKFDGYLDDYTCLANGLVTLYEATFNERWIDIARELMDLVLRWFADDSEGFFYTARDHEQLIARQKDLYDNATPSGNSMAATVLLRLGKLTGRGEYLAAAEGTLRAAAGVMQQAPSAAGQMLIAYDFYLGPTPELVLLGEPAAPRTAAMLTKIRRSYLPNKVLALRAMRADGEAGPLDPLFAGKEPGPDEPTLFVCENFACRAPISGVEAITNAVNDLLHKPGRPEIGVGLL